MLAKIVAVSLLVGLPLLGLVLAGRPLARYFEFPPRSAYVAHAPFSWPVFVVVAASEILIGAVLIRFLAPIPPSSQSPHRHLLPRWGYFGLATLALSWILAWTRFPWFASLQPHTFTPLWLSYIICINAFTFRRAGRCLLTHETRYFLGLFPASAAFWWFFEYLNRFTQNWHYLGADHFTPLEYFIFATLSFSTVLPAVLSTAELIAVYGRFLPRTGTLAISNSIFQIPNSRLGSPIRNLEYGIWNCALVLSAAGLLLLGVFPNVLFPMIWLAPVGFLISNSIFQIPNSRLGSPIWNLEFGIWNSALSALACGFFWEMWNYYSLAKWVYEIPYVGRFRIFEMPVLGYVGYLPFGVTCVMIAACLKPRSASILDS